MELPIISSFEMCLEIYISYVHVCNPRKEADISRDRDLKNPVKGTATSLQIRQE
jgi:hypothetical protein